MKRRKTLRLKLLEEESDGPKLVLIDEVQRVPELLNEIHWLIENSQYSFGMSCSNARRLRRRGVNLLGGRALRYRLHGLSAHELRDDFKLERFLNTGYLPRIVGSENWRQYLDAYVNDYLVTEVAAEAEVQRLPAFSTFLTAAAISDTEIVNFSNIASECGVSSPTVSNYYQIVFDAMHGDWVPAFRSRAKRRASLKSKFYFADVGVVNTLAGRHAIKNMSSGFGAAFENWVHHELRTYIEYQQLNKRITYWRIGSTVEVDFVVGNMDVAIEAKSTARVRNRHLKGIRELIKEYPEVKRRVLVCTTYSSYKTEDGILVLSVDDFIKRLWSGELIETA